MENYNFEYFSQLIGIEQIYLRAALAALVAFGATYISIPKIIRVSLRKHLMDVPGDRSSHLQKIPNLGGVAIYYAVVIASTVFGASLFTDFTFFYAALVILFFIGLMDDILVVAPTKKLYAQILAAGMIVIGSGARIYSLFGLFGIDMLPVVVSIILTFFVFIVVINSYNLIDGIDGLAGGVGIVVSGGFAIIFHRIGEIHLFVLSISLLFSLLAFLRFNLSKKYKIFMGDTGSMIVGFILCFLAVNFINLCSNPNNPNQVYIPTAPVIAVALLIVPMMDTVSVIIIRLLKRQSIFRADKNHIHHRLMNLGFNHIQTSAIIVFVNILIILLAYILHFSVEINLMLATVFLVALFLSLLPYLISKIKSKNKPIVN